MGDDKWARENVDMNLLCIKTANCMLAQAWLCNLLLNEPEKSFPAVHFQLMQNSYKSFPIKHSFIDENGASGTVPEPYTQL